MIYRDTYPPNRPDITRPALGMQPSVKLPQRERIGKGQSNYEHNAGQIEPHVLGVIIGP